MRTISPAEIAAIDEFVTLRRDLHSHPELGLEEHRTSDIVARELACYGYKVARGLSKTGVVGTLVCGSGNRAIALRADMDALPITEETGLPYASRSAGLMHACGHDGHTATLLAAARTLAERRNFDGTLHVIFQPAEENWGGAKIMVEEGIFQQFPCDAVFGMHNEPALPFGQFTFRDGPIMAAVDECYIQVIGEGGHGSTPEFTRDPVVAGASIVMALQSIVSRNIAAMDPAVVTVAAFHSGTVSNIIPSSAEIVVGIRSFDRVVRDEIERRINLIAKAQAESYGLSAKLRYVRSYDPTINHPAETAFARDLAREMFGAERAVDFDRPMMGSEDFAYFLNERPGSYFFLGTAKGPADPGLHHPKFDFNDDALAVGAAFWVALAERYLQRA
ncbi:M20 aminoacylase family protein [Paracoccus sp. MBLB3053]|uniref:M20 aminoacylase family protein n=1 Tax=Paracoccus aurantius TaxID=3073814 RepID=A0ABU2HWA6_9RHOB|nr:M20 aminoacylase family protein [Paracoccus sp. MBLB3053]MDS9469332.1 M20 aminoacylase family protein [Paracoccus sp. MBLB3053]